MACKLLSNEPTYTVPSLRRPATNQHQDRRVVGEAPVSHSHSRSARLTINSVNKIVDAAHIHGLLVRAQAGSPDGLALCIKDPLDPPEASSTAYKPSAAPTKAMSSFEITETNRCRVGVLYLCLPFVQTSTSLCRSGVDAVDAAVHAAEDH